MTLDERIAKNSQYHVDANEFANLWKNESWSAFIDLIGFGAICKRSQQTALNSIIRFHKVLQNIKSKFPRGKLHQFTDCAYYVSDCPLDVMAFSIEVMNESLLLNEYSMRKRHTVFCHLISPRITIGYGDFLNIPSKTLPDHTIVESFDKILAGSSIVSAYEIEKKSFAYALSISQKHFDIFKQDIKIYQLTDKSLCDRIIAKWIKKPHVSNAGILEIPWVFISNYEIGKNRFKPETMLDAISKLRMLEKILIKMRGEYYSERLPIEVGKHQAALHRHIYDCICAYGPEMKYNVESYEDMASFLDGVEKSLRKKIRETLRADTISTKE